MADLLQNRLSLESFTPRHMSKTFLEVMLRSADFFQTITPDSEIKTTLTEFRNKVQAFYFFEYVDAVLGLSSDSNLTLPQMIERASTLGPFLSVWATEGLGHYYTDRYTADSLPDKLLLDDAPVGHLPREALVPLHAGMGLALAESMLKKGYDSTTLVECFLRLCRNNARPEYLGCAVEALGLVVWNLRPELTLPLDREFAESNEELLAYFWHGVGRGIYFTLFNSLPFWQGYRLCIKEPPHLVGKMNAVAGFAWALTLVNIRHPEIVAAFLKHYPTQLSQDEAFSNGVFCALVIWLESAPKDSSVQAFWEYHPGWLDPPLLQLWDRQVRQAVRHSLHVHEKPVIDLGSLFRYQPISNLGD